MEDELIYTAITRAKRNLIVINIDNYKYDNFFIEVKDKINVKFIDNKDFL